MLIETQIIYNYLLSQFGINFPTKILWIVVVLDLIFFPLMKVEIDFEVSVLVHLPSPHLQTEKFNESVTHAPYDMDYIIWTIWYGPWNTFWLEWSCFLCLTSWYSSLKTLPQSHLNELLLWVFSWIFKYSGEVVSYPHNWLKWD